ncbi:MAG: alpha/beta hydrolase [Actinobacteria bacterium]|nr:alpha/beta hydrolase [Actinomycetota bacterium]
MPQTHHRVIDVDGIPIFYREAGDQDAPVVLLLHGAPSSSAMFRRLIPLLADDYHVIAPDYPGFGNSATPGVNEFAYTFDHLADVIERFLEDLGVDRFAMYVQDYGAPVGWRLYLSDPARVTAIVSQSGNAYEEGFVDAFWAPLWRHAASRREEDRQILLHSLDVESIRWQYVHGLADPSVVDPDAWIRDAMQVNRPGNPDIQLALYDDYPCNRALYPDLQALFREDRVPLLAVWGRNDEIFGPDGARAFARDLQDARIELLDGGHWLLESHLHEVAEIMRGFLVTARRTVAARTLKA